MNNISINKNNSGFGLIEIILVIGVGMAVFLGVEQYLTLSLKAATEDSYQTEALYLVKATLEQARAVRDEAIRNDNWALLYDLSVDPVQYTFAVNSATAPESWEILAGTRTEGKYTVWFTTSKVSRDAVSDDIVSSGGVVDPESLKINSHVSWVEDGIIKQSTISEYLVNF